MLGPIQENSTEGSGEDFASAEAAAAAERRARLPEIARNFGVKAAHCPNCGVQLQKFPKRKIKCKSCAKPVYPRKNPVTNQVVLIKETDFDRLRELQCYVDGSWESWFSNFFELETIRAQLATEWGLDDAAKVPVADAGSTIASRPARTTTAAAHVTTRATSRASDWVQSPTA